VRVTLVVLFAICTLASAARAQGFFSSSPGPLSKSHASLDSQQRCNDCHVNGTRDISNAQCLACHDHQDLGARIAAGKGFHASALVQGKNCAVCHKEHFGATFDLMGWSSIKNGPKAFDHALTGWPLNGKHASTDCARCHKATNRQGLTTYMGTDRLCGAAACHGGVQPHKLDRKELLACERCHSESVWKPEKKILQFDHNDRKDAAMPILGSHKDVACTKCHPRAVFNLPFANPTSCGNDGCHKSVHTGHLFGKRPCEWCHSPTFRTFQQKTNADIPFFDHTERTRFDLGAHKRLRCYDCHTKALGEARPVALCEQCHAKDNKHGNRFDAFGKPPRCSTCHPTTGWKQKVFDHARQTRFPLTARHAAILCRACHRGTSPSDFERFADAACKGCHAHRTAHAEPKHPQGRWSSAQCLKCHARPGDKAMRNPAELEREWHGPQSDFPLKKKHAGLACQKCHKNRAAKSQTTFEEESPECGNRCHEDSLHRGTLGKACSGCHESGSWSGEKFDHNVPTFPDGTPGFPLRGGHASNRCEACHGPNRKFRDTPRNCSADACHGKDDAHKGRLGTRCEQCHVETGDLIFNHNTQSAFHLDGAHLQVRCADCHPSITFKPRPQTCFGCHPEPTVHKGQYGTTCQQCHTTRTWDDIKPLHDVGDFALRGQHGNIACERCHRDSRPLAGSGNLCINCHRQDDIHNNSLSPKCGECHTQWSFAPARFDHSRVGCNLTGVHRTIACFDCHRNGNFSAITGACVTCHLDDAISVGTHADRLTSCTGSSCHNATTWKDYNKGTGLLRDSVCR